MSIKVGESFSYSPCWLFISGRGRFLAEIYNDTAVTDCIIIFRCNYLQTLKTGGSNLAELKFEITKEIGVLSENVKGWTKELNMVSWNDREPKYDLREWSPDHSRMGKGITLTEEDITSLKNLLNGVDEEDDIDESKMV